MGPLLVAALIVLPGCSNPRKLHKHRAFVTEADAAAYLREALEAENADVRREAVVRLGETRHVRRTPVIDGLILVAETDTSASVRRAAIWALGESGSDRTLPTLLGLLADNERRDPGVRAPEESVRQEAMAAIAVAVADGADTSAYRHALQDTAVRLLAEDSSRDVRISSAQLLGYMRDEEALHALIAGLEQGDFGVVYECERSLMRMTGHTHDRDPWEWRQWVALTEDPFADAGRLDDQIQQGQRNWFQRNWDTTRRALASFGPKKD